MGASKSPWATCDRIRGTHRRLRATKVMYPSKTRDSSRFAKVRPPFRKVIRSGTGCPTAFGRTQPWPGRASLKGKHLRVWGWRSGRPSRCFLLATMRQEREDGLTDLLLSLPKSHVPSPATWHSEKPKVFAEMWLRAPKAQSRPLPPPSPCGGSVPGCGKEAVTTETGKPLPSGTFRCSDGI